MDCRDRIVIRIPQELAILVQLWHQKCTRNTSLNASITTLLETHPALVELAQQVYDMSKVQITPKGF